MEGRTLNINARLRLSHIDHALGVIKRIDRIAAAQELDNIPTWAATSIQNTCAIPQVGAEPRIQIIEVYVHSRRCELLCVLVVVIH